MIWRPLPLSERVARVVVLSSSGAPWIRRSIAGAGMGLPVSEISK